MSDGKARAIRELSRSLSHSPRNITSPSPPPSDSNPTKHSGFGTETDNFFDDPDVLMSTQHRLEDDTNTLPQYPRIRSTAKKLNTWHMLRSEQPVPDTSMVNKEFGDFDHSLSDEEAMSVEQARGFSRSNRGTPNKMSSQFNSLYDITPPTNRSRKSYVAETGSLRRDAQIRRASRNDVENASPRPKSARNPQAIPGDQDRRRTSLAQLHAKISEDESSFMDQRPPTLTVDSTKNTRWGNRSRQTSLQMDGMVDAPQRDTTHKSRPATAQNATAQSFILPDLPNLTELVSGVFDDGTPVFSKTAPARSRFSAPPNGGRRPQHIPVEGVPIPEEEKAIFAALHQLQDKVAQMEHERAQQDRRLEEQDMELIELRATTQAQEKLRRSDSAQDSDSGKGSWKVEKTRLDATVQTLRTKLDRSERKAAVLEIEKKRLNTERDNMASQLSVAFQTCEELKNEKGALSTENDALRQEIDALRAENEELRNQLEQEHSLRREETVQLKQQFDQAANATEKENATLHAELARVRAQHDENTQQLSRKDIELRKARQEQADYAQLKSYHDSLQSQLASLKAKREEEAKRWTRQEAALKAQVDRRDETIRQFHDMTQEQTNEAIRLDNDNLRHELAQLSAKHEDETEHWARKEAELKRKVQRREDAARRTLDMTREVLSVREANEQQFGASGPTSMSKGKENAFAEPLQRKPSYRREDTRTRIKNRVQQEVRNSKTISAPQQPSQIEESPRKSYSKASRFSSRSVSAPIPANQNAHVESDVESTTDLSLAPRGTPYTSRSNYSVKPSTTIQPPADLDLTELSLIDSNQIAQLRRALEEERAAARRRVSSAPSEQQARDDTVRSQRQTREDTIRSVASAKSERRPSLPRKSSLKDITQRTNVTQFEEDVTGNVSNLDMDAEATQTKQSAIDASMLSNTSRRRRSAPTEMTSAFIVPDIKLDTLKQATTTINISQKTISKDHDNTNCTVCRRDGLTTTTDAFRVPKLVPVSSRMPDDVDATLRPARSPKEALALVVKELQDERTHLHMELAVMRAMLESHDASLGNRKRRDINSSIQDILRRLEIKDMQIYNLYDVLEGQQTDELTELDVENLTQQIRAEEEKTQSEPEKKAKKVTIRSFVDEDDNSIEVGRGVNHELEDEETQELPWEGFDDTGMEGDVSYGALEGWRTNVH
ncbi:Nn.00g044630.m01.CDS01 [Neocucurbitaria sp. VM-36]